MLFRAGIQMLVESQPDLVFAGGGGNGEEAVVLVERGDIDVVLMDVRMPVLDGVTATRRIMELFAGRDDDPPKVIVLTTFTRDEAVVEAVHAGASGYLLKSAEPEFLLASIRAVHAGHAVLAPGAAHDLFRQRARPPLPDLRAIDALSSRERDVFLLVAKGLSNGEIGGSMFLSEATVKSHVRSILSKLEVRTRIQLVAFAYEHRLLG